MVLPNFLIVGAMKAGTSALAYALQEHPDVFVPARELHFFNREERYRQGLSYYEEQFAGYRGEAAVGDKTPAYSFHERAPERIAQLLPTAKLIWLLRNPTERAHSHYWFFVRKGMERLPFERALTLEPQRMARDRMLGYRERGIYVRQIGTFLQWFPREQMCILLHEQWRREPDLVLRSICRFLDVDPDVPFRRAGEERNTTSVPRSKTVQWATARLLSRKGARLRKTILRWNVRTLAGYPSMDPETRRELDEFYRPWNEELARRFDLDLSDWHTSERVP